MKKVIIIISIFILFGNWQTCQALIVNYPPIPQAPNPAEGLPQAITYIYMFALGAVGIIALLAMMIGAIMYVTSAGNPSRAADAKDRIFSALLGILLLLASVLILRIINPDLVGDLGGFRTELPELPSLGDTLQWSTKLTNAGLGIIVPLVSISI